MASYKKLATIGFVFFLLSLTSAHAALLFLTSDSQQTVVGGTVNVTVHIGSDLPVKAVQGVLYYPKNIFDVKQVSRANSIFNIWLNEPTVNSSTGEISFLGASTNAFSGASMPAFTFALAARAGGAGTVGFRSAAVTAGDGTGANILSSSTVMSFSVGPGFPPLPTSTLVTFPQTGSAPDAAPLPAPKPVQIVRPTVTAAKVPDLPIVTVPLYLNQDAWYNTIANFLAQWDLGADVTDVATEVDQNPLFEPTVSEGLFDNKTFGAVGEGIWYLHVRFKNSAGWGPTAHFRIAIDTTPPLPFTATMQEGPVTEVLFPTVLFATKDQSSGVAFYRILADGNLAGTASSTSFTLPGLSFGAHSIEVQAVDNANNETASRVSVTVAPPPFFTVAGIKITEEVFFGIIIAVILVGIAIGWRLGYKAKSKRKFRALIATRDVAMAFGVIQKNVDQLLGYFGKGPPKESQLEEMNFLLQETKEKVDKMKRYVSENVGEIER
jgi:hypothetical protein